MKQTGSPKEILVLSERFISCTVPYLTLHDLFRVATASEMISVLLRDPKAWRLYWQYIKAGTCAVEDHKL